MIFFLKSVCNNYRMFYLLIQNGFKLRKLVNFLAKNYYQLTLMSRFCRQYKKYDLSCGQLQPTKEKCNPFFQKDSRNICESKKHFTIRLRADTSSYLCSQIRRIVVFYFVLLRQYRLYLVTINEKGPFHFILPFPLCSTSKLENKQNFFRSFGRAGSGDTNNEDTSHV